MKHLLTAVLSALLILSFAGCGGRGGENLSPAEPISETTLPDGADPQENDPVRQEVAGMESILDSYYEAQNGPVFEYFQKHSIQRFAAMWVEEATGIEAPQWYFDTFTRYQILDHEMAPATRDGVELYSCVFSDGADRYGYLVMRYEEDSPAMGNFGIAPAASYPYDLAYHLDAIAESLKQTDIDLSTATAERVSWLDTTKNRSDQVILLRDGKGDTYLCYLGGPDFEVEKLD